MLISRGYRLSCFVSLFLVMHKEYGHSAFFGIYIRVPYNGKDYIIPGSLLVSLKYFLDKKPLLMLVKTNESGTNMLILNADLRKLNHSVVGEDGMVNTDLFKNWIPVCVLSLFHIGFFF